MTNPPEGLRDGPVYLDHNSTTPVDPRVVAAMLPYLTTHFGNPSSGHAYGGPPRRALETARGQVAGLIGATDGRVVFTGAGSEADVLAIFGTVLARLAGAPGGSGEVEVITQPTEHPAVLEACRALHERHGVRVTYLPVGADGRVGPDDLAAAIGPRTALVSVMAANNETGVLQPVRELARVAHAHGALFHTDAAQAVGKIPVDVGELGVDLLTVVGHKMYAPKGIAALYAGPGVRLAPVILGGGQEGGLRSGTEPVPLAVALGEAADLARRELAAGEAERLRDLRDLLHERLDAALPGRVRLNGHVTERLPGTLNIAIDGADGAAILAAAPGVAASTGSACHTGQDTPSPVLDAMSSDVTVAPLRLSVGRWTTRDEIAHAADEIAAAARTLSLAGH